jgi:hypothetical protein
VGGPDQRRLLNHLLIEKQYNPLERPVQNDSKTLPVRINLALQQIVDFVSEIKVNLYFVYCGKLYRMERIKSLLLVAGWF